MKADPSLYKLKLLTVSEKDHIIQAVEEKNRKIEQALSQKENEVLHYHEILEDIQNKVRVIEGSYSFRLGMILLWPARKAKSFLQRLKKYSHEFERF